MADKKAIPQMILIRLLNLHFAYFIYKLSQIIYKKLNAEFIAGFYVSKLFRNSFVQLV